MPASATSSTPPRSSSANLITYDAHYYKSTDAAAYYEAYGDIVGGIGSYPVLGNPHYHQPHDCSKTINHQLVTEVAQDDGRDADAAGVEPVADQECQGAAVRTGTVDVTWTPSPEPASQRISSRMVPRRTRCCTRDGHDAQSNAPEVPAGMKVAVKAVNAVVSGGRTGALEEGR